VPIERTGYRAGDDRRRLGDPLAARMTPDQERWAEALAVHKQHGEGAPSFVAERIGALALAGDIDGIERWKAIAARLDQLYEGALQ
jgi:hypothetical protein